jgi:predicted RNase H-like nuclease
MDAGPEEDGSGCFAVPDRISEPSERLSTVASVLIDIPIGLRREHGEEYLCGKMVRAVLQPERGSSVFPAPSR